MPPWQLMNLQSLTDELGPDGLRFGPVLLSAQQNHTPVIRPWPVPSNGLSANSEEIEHTKIRGNSKSKLQIEVTHLQLEDRAKVQASVLQLGDHILQQAFPSQLAQVFPVAMQS